VQSADGRRARAGRSGPRQLSTFLSSAMVNTSTVLTVTGITLATSFVGYAVYFDYQRRNNPAFRKKLCPFCSFLSSTLPLLVPDSYYGSQIVRESKRLQKAADVEANQAREARSGALERGLEQLSQEKLPSTPEQMESFFLEHVSIAEALAAKGQYFLPRAKRFDAQGGTSLGPDFYVAAALSFYKALKVYPAPTVRQSRLSDSRGTSCLTRNSGYRSCCLSTGRLSQRRSLIL
jgi:import receptor subunit TOM20